MKKYSFLFVTLLTLFSLLAISCSEEGKDENNNGGKEETVADEIVYTGSGVNYFENTMDFDSNGGQAVISFSSNVDWQLTMAETQNPSQWCSVSQEKGTAGKFNITVTVTENTAPDDRNVVLRLEAGTATKTIVVNQKQKNSITLTTDRFEVGNEGGIINVEFRTNVDYTIEIPEACREWIGETTRSRSMISRSKEFKIAENTEYEKREGEIIIKSDGIEEFVKVYQAGTSVLVLSQNEYAFGCEGGSIRVDLSSNFDVQVDMPNVDWVAASKSSRAVSSHTLYFEVAANESDESREATIVFKDINNTIQADIKITQTKKGISNRFDYEVDGIYYNKTSVSNVSVTYGPNAYKGSIVIPQEIEVKGRTFKVTQIENSAFYNCTGLEEIDTGNGVVKIQTSTFEGCSGLRKITLRNKVSTIEKDAFKGCSGLKELVIEDGTSALTFESSGSYPTQFRECPLETIYLGRNLSYSLGWGMAWSPFSNTPITSIVFGPKVTEVPTGCCKNCRQLKQVNIPSTITTLKPYSFFNTGINTFVVPNTVGSICNHAISAETVIIEDGESLLDFFVDGYYKQSEPFEKSLLQKIYLGRNIQYEDYVSSSGYSNLYSPLAFSKLIEVGFGPQFTTIGQYLFYGCEDMKSIKLPSSIAHISTHAFDRCKGLTTIYSERATPVSINSDTFATDTYTNSKLLVPVGSANKYQKATGWKNFRAIEEYEM